MKTIAKSYLITFQTGLVNPQAMRSVLLAAYQASEITWSEAKEISEQMGLSLE